MKIGRHLGVALAALFAGSAYAQAPDPSQVYIRGINFAGSGCPAGSVSTNVAPDAKAFTLLFDQYIAEGGPGVPASSTRKNCQVLVDLQ